MITEEQLFSHYRGKRVLLDANLLLLLMIGSYQRLRISQFKRTAMFTVKDFDTLVTVLQQFSSMITTPHVLTEVSSLSNSLPEHLKPSWWKHFESQIALFTEIYEPATNLTQVNAFNPFGLTDAAVQHAGKDTLIPTEDFRLAGFLHAQGIRVLNFRHLCQTL